LPPQAESNSTTGSAASTNMTIRIRMPVTTRRSPTRIYGATAARAGFSS